MKKMKALVNLLNEASERYYNSDSPIMSDREFDMKIEELKAMEKETGVVLSNSPTQKVGAPVLSLLPKVTITPKPMLSLDKCHSVNEIADFAKGKDVIAMVKCDGLSVRIKYAHGRLVSANTRGNGVEGTDITEHVKHFTNVPLSISKDEEYIIDGEAIIYVEDFNKINTNNQFANPRNTASGALNVLDTQIVADRRLSFLAWDVIKGSSATTLSGSLAEAETLGFTVVPMVAVISKKYQTAITEIMDLSEELGIPCDGVVFKFDNIAYGNSLGATSHHFKNGIAWKPQVTLVRSVLTGIDWTMGRTGVLTPVAEFEPVELDGSIISRASLSNVSVCTATLHGAGWKNQIVWISKRNLIIPKIESAEKDDGITPKQYFQQPSKCPICGEPLCEHGTDAITLVCENPNCEGKLVNIIDHFAGKKGLDIKGMSLATIGKLIDWGWLNDISDVFKLVEHKDEWAQKPGFGKASVNKILSAIEDAKHTTLDKYIAALGIPLIGTSVSKELVKYFTTYEDFRQAINDRFDFSKLDGFAESKTEALLNYNYELADMVAREWIVFEEDTSTNIQNTLDGKTIVITGSLSLYKNRAALTDSIVAHGGKVAGSVSGNTDYLINNDKESGSAKNKAAKRLNIPILSEAEFVEQFLTDDKK